MSIEKPTILKPSQHVSLTRLVDCNVHGYYIRMQRRRWSNSHVQEAVFKGSRDQSPEHCLQTRTPTPVADFGDPDPDPSALHR